MASELYDFGVFSVHAFDVTTPEGKKSSFKTLVCPDWVNVISFTVDNEIALVRQYRYGIAEYTVEFPGGIAESECPILDAAKQELLEETGLASESWLPVGGYRPNPALQNNWCHTFICRSAYRTGASPESGCEVILARAPAFRAKWRGLMMQQSLMATSMLLALDAHGGPQFQELCRLFFR